MIKVLITGGGGLLGQYLNRELADSFKILTTYNSKAGNCVNYNNLKLDLTDNKKLDKVFSEFKPDVVVHLASVSNTVLADKFEKNFVINVNVNATKLIAELCYKYNSKLIYTSTDLVYNGDVGIMLSEESELEPLSLYAQTKLHGEKVVQETFDDFIILRTALMYGFPLNNNTCFFNSMYESLKAGNSINLFNDQFRTPLSLKEAARIIKQLISIEANNEIINFGGKERISRLELGEILCEVANLDKSLINSVSMDEIDFNYKVKDVSMDTTKLDDLGIRRLSVGESITEMF